MKKWGIILLGVWLIATGLISLLNISFTGIGAVMAVLALAAGTLLILGDRKGKLTRNLGTLLTAIWLMATGLLSLLNVSFLGRDVILAVLASAAGVLLLLGK